MYDLAKQCSTFGEFTTSIALLTEAYGGWVRPVGHDEHAEWFNLVRKVLGAYEDASVIEIEGEVVAAFSLFRLRVVDFDETNAPRQKVSRHAPGTDENREYERQRKAGQRAAKRTGKDAAKRHNVPTVPGTVPVPAGKERTVEESSSRSVTSAPHLPHSYPQSSSRPARFQRTDHVKISDETEHEMRQLLADCFDRDDGSEGVFLGLARKGAGLAHFADAREALRVVSPSKPAGYAVKTITNRLADESLTASQAETKKDLAAYQQFVAERDRTPA